MANFDITVQAMVAIRKLPRIGNVRAIALLKHINENHLDADTMYCAIQESDATNTIKNKFTPEICDQKLKEASEFLNTLDPEIKVVSYYSEGYPKYLLGIDNPPSLLFVKGDPSTLSNKSVAIVGTREASEFALEFAFEVAKTCALAGYTVVSGLAAGCDTKGHEGCMIGGHPTMAVLAHGFNYLFPEENKPLAEQIVEDGGALVTEYLPQTPPIGRQFVERDRLQSGLSRGVILIESPEKGGSMHTVRFGLEQDRLVAAVLPQDKSSLSNSNGGNQKIVTDGGKLINGTEDLLDFLEILQTYKLKQEASIDESDLNIGINETQPGLFSQEDI